MEADDQRVEDDVLFGTPNRARPLWGGYLPADFFGQLSEPISFVKRRTSTCKRKEWEHRKSRVGGRHMGCEGGFTGRRNRPFERDSPC